MACVICNDKCKTTSESVYIKYVNGNVIEICGRCAKKRVKVDVGHQPPINYDANCQQLVPITRYKKRDKIELSDHFGEVKP